MLLAGWSDSEPITLTTPICVPSVAATIVIPRPGASAERFAGRMTRWDVAR
jgi:hypothetical protein